MGRGRDGAAAANRCVSGHGAALASGSVKYRAGCSGHQAKIAAMSIMA
jgi:hypothetical protein